MKKTEIADKIAYYLSLPYTFMMTKNEDGSFFIKVKELEGCMSEGDNPEDAHRMIQDAMTCWIESMLEDGHEIPLPESMQEQEFSGRISIRIPRILHCELTNFASIEGLSLNAMIIHLLSKNLSVEKISNDIFKKIETIYESSNNNNAIKTSKIPILKLFNETHQRWNFGVDTEVEALEEVRTA